MNDKHRNQRDENHLHRKTKTRTKIKYKSNVVTFHRLIGFSGKTKAHFNNGKQCPVKMSTVDLKLCYRIDGSAKNNDRTKTKTKNKMREPMK